MGKLPSFQTGHGGRFDKERKCRMNYLKRTGLVLFLALSVSGIVFSADNAAVLLEEAIYIEETRGDFDKAATIYRQIADDAESGRAAAAQALYRLGRYYEARGRAAEAKEAFTRLTTQYPEQKELVSRVPNLAADAMPALPPLLPVPWEDDEMLKYSAAGNRTVRSMKSTKTTDATIAYLAPALQAGAPLTLIAESALEKGGETWKFISISRSAPLTYSIVSVEGDTFNSIEMRTRSRLDSDTSLTTLKSPIGGMLVLVNSGGEHIKTTIPGATTGYYEGQLIYLLRRLPLQTGLEAFIPIINSSGFIVSQRIYIEGRERVVTPAGTFNAWKIANGNKIYWISNDSRRYPVKIVDYDYTNTEGDGVLELVSISKYEKNRPVEYAGQNIRFAIPPGWFFLPATQASIVSSSTLDSPVKERWTSMDIGDPEFETGSSISLMEYSSMKDTQLLLSETIDGLLNYNMSEYPGTLLRPGSRENITVAGFPGIRLITDRKRTDDNEIVVYYYVISAGDKAVRAFFRSKKENFDRFKPMFDSIIESIQFK